MSEQKPSRHKVIGPRSLSYSYYYKADQPPPQRNQKTANTSAAAKPTLSGGANGHRFRLPAIAVVLILFLAATFIFGNKGDTNSQTGVKGAHTSVAANTSDPASLSVVVNKSHPLNPKTYAPSDLVVAPIPKRTDITDSEAEVSARIVPSLTKLVADAAAQGVHLELESGYRSYDFQTHLYNYYVSTQGQTNADEQSARPGYSEHQTGLAVDLGSSTDSSCNVKSCFGDTPEGQWIAANAYKYGFIVRYTAADQAVTGYEAEAWHLRYVGTDISTEMHNRSITTLEKLFNISGGTAYH